MSVEAFPLQWPIGYKRTTIKKESRFKQTMGQARDFLYDEIDSLKAKDLVVSTNIPVTKGGLLYASYMNKKIDDPGVAIYFNYQGKPVVMCCDQYEKVWENIYALGKGIEALRGMARWGVSNFLERAFTGFTAIPETTGSYQYWWDILGVSDAASYDEIKSAYKKLALVHHPDRGGTVEKFTKISDAYNLGIAKYL